MDCNPFLRGIYCCFVQLQLPSSVSMIGWQLLVNSYSCNGERNMFILIILILQEATVRLVASGRVLRLHLLSGTKKSVLGASPAATMCSEGRSVVELNRTQQNF